jgi:hypothetical protein
MATVSLPNDLTDGTVAYGSQVKANEDAIVNDYNGNIQNVNCAANMGLVDTKLAQITTAAKVSGTALTLLANIPSAAGVIPDANLKQKRVVVLKAFAETETVIVVDGAIYFTCPTELNGMNLVAVGCSVYTTSSGAAPAVSIERGRRSAANGALTYADMLSTGLTIDAGEYDSANATTPAVIDATKDDIVVSTYVDIIRVNVDTAGTATAGLEVRLSFQLP